MKLVIRSSEAIPGKFIIVTDAWQSAQMTAAEIGAEVTRILEQKQGFIPLV